MRTATTGIHGEQVSTLAAISAVALVAPGGPVSRPQPEYHRNFNARSDRSFIGASRLKEGLKEPVVNFTIKIRIGTPEDLDGARLDMSGRVNHRSGDDPSLPLHPARLFDREMKAWRR
jgi:hypothetical protein